jgi:dienelactone hydrolase
MLRNLLVPLVLLAADAGLARAAVKTRNVTYDYEGTTLKGFLAWDDATEGKRPGVLVVHEWWGLNAYARSRARQLAKLGYVAFACDMYGEGKTTEHPKEAGAMAGEVRKNLKTWQGRALAGLKILQDNEHVDARRLAAIGYCFGGSTALELAYRGADLKAVVTFHAALPVADAEQAKAIKAKIMVCHGAADKFIPEATAQKFRAALEDAKVDYQMIYFGGAVHSFSVPGADKHNIPGIAYNAEADHRSWRYMRDLFHEVFAEKGSKTRPARPGASAGR